jgi:hypothetical protein
MSGGSSRASAEGRPARGTPRARGRSRRKPAGRGPGDAPATTRIPYASCLAPRPRLTARGGCPPSVSVRPSPARIGDAPRRSVPFAPKRDARPTDGWLSAERHAKVPGWSTGARNWDASWRRGRRAASNDRGDPDGPPGRAGLTGRGESGAVWPSVAGLGAGGAVPSRTRARLTNAGGGDNVALYTRPTICVPEATTVHHRRDQPAEEAGWRSVLPGRIGARGAAGDAAGATGKEV